MRTATLNKKQLKAMDDVINKFGGPKKIKAMPLEDKLIVRKELKFAGRGLPIGDVKVLTQGNMMETYSLENMECMTPNEKERIVAEFDKSVERIEIAAELSPKISKGIIRSCVKNSIAVFSITMGVTFISTGNPALIAAGAAAIGVGGVSLISGVKDILRVREKQEMMA